MFAYQAVALAGSIANPATSALGRPITIEVSTSTGTRRTNGAGRRPSPRARRRRSRTRWREPSRRRRGGLLEAGLVRAKLGVALADGREVLHDGLGDRRLEVPVARALELR